MSTITPQVGSPSVTFRELEKIRHRDDRGGDITHNGFRSSSTEAAARQLWRNSAGWTDNNRDGTYDVTYEFRSAPADRKEVRGGKTGFSPVLDNQRQQTRRSLQSIADVANVRFTEGKKTENSEGHIVIGNYGQKVDTKGHPYNGESHATYPREGGTSDVWLVVTGKDRTIVNAGHGNAGRHTITHELGHAMGLAHPGSYNGVKKDGTGYAAQQVHSHEDSQSHTGMSYRGERTSYMNHKGFRSSAPQLDDITAYQSKYGANQQTRTDDTVYGFNSNTNRDFLSLNAKGEKMVAAIWDAGGKDTLDFSGYEQDQKISLKDGTFSDVGGLKGNVAIAYGVTIENALGGSGKDWLVGNDADNELNGGAGDDVIFGGAGADKLWGGKGSDTFVYGRVSESNELNGVDEIMDFVSGEDHVDISGIRQELGGQPLKRVEGRTGSWYPGEYSISYDPAENISALRVGGGSAGEALVVRVHGHLQPGDLVT